MEFTPIAAPGSKVGETIFLLKAIGLCSMNSRHEFFNRNNGMMEFWNVRIMIIHFLIKKTYFYPYIIPYIIVKSVLKKVSFRSEGRIC